MKATKKVRLTTHREVLKKWMRDPVFRRGYNDQLLRLRLTDALISLREKQGLTQSDLARRIGTTQAFVSKLENAESHNYTVETLQRIVLALNGELVIRIRPKTPAHAPA
mgnify:FL=1